jgi:hypothetical protein
MNMKAKMYFRTEESEHCHEIEYFRSDMKDDGLTEMEVFVAVPDKSTHHFWCGAVDEVCLTEDSPCGKHCEDYAPINKKSGKCKFKTHCYESGEKAVISLQNNEPISVT